MFRQFSRRSSKTASRDPEAPPPEEEYTSPALPMKPMKAKNHGALPSQVLCFVYFYTAWAVSFHWVCFALSRSSRKKCGRNFIIGVQLPVA
jgi:hypothetical protein